MQVREIMTGNVECVPPDLSIEHAARKMKVLDVGFLPICENDRLIGAVTDRDIVIRAVAEGNDYQTTARDIMTKEVHYCFEDDDIEECAHQMKENSIKRILVLNRDKRLVGVVSIGDLSKVEKAEAGEALKDISEAA
jgi:CBS domain-containing protein